MTPLEDQYHKNNIILYILKKTFLSNGMCYFNNLLPAAVELFSICNGAKEEKANIFTILLF